jgi:CRISPR-associated protein Csm5
MNYRLTVVTPLLVGGGDKLAPIDYMVWKDQVNVLDQPRIFRLLSKGPRLEGYLGQLRRAEKLDFASWGGFAQNYAARRIPFEHPSLTPYWNETRAEHLFVPTFASGPSGPYLPASALKGALRTAFVFSRWNAGVIKEIGSRMESDRVPRRPGEAAEAMTLGASGADPMRVISTADSTPVAQSMFKVYMLRVASLQSRGGAKLELAWKQAPPFAEMAIPGTVFTGRLSVSESAKASQKREQASVEKIFEAANDHAAQLIAVQRLYAEQSGLQRVRASLDSLDGRLNELRGHGNACLLNMGWAAGFLSKAGFLDTTGEDYRKLLARLPQYERALRSGLPFPKTRRIVFEQNQPSTLAGWAVLEIQ